MGATNIGGQSTNYEDGAVIGGHGHQHAGRPVELHHGTRVRAQHGGSSFDGIISRLCVDSSTARCPQCSAWLELRWPSSSRLEPWC